MKFLIIFLISTFSIFADSVTFLVKNAYDFNIDLKENCLLDGSKGNTVYEMIIVGKCSLGDYKGKIVTCIYDKIIQKIENGIITFTANAKCMRK